MNDVLDTIKQQWGKECRLPDDLHRLNRLFAQRLSARRVVTHQQTLAKSVKRNFYVGIFMPLVAPLLVCILHLPVWFAAVYSIYGVATGVAAYILAEHIGHTDLMGLPVAQALEKAVLLRRCMRRLRVAKLLFGAAVLFAGACLLTGHANDSVLLGGIAGLTIGAGIAAVNIYSQERESRRLIDLLQ